MTRHHYAAAFLVVLGTAQMAGDLTGVVAVRAIAAASGASPAPKVFAAVQGLETYSTRFFFEAAGRRIELTPALYSRMRGPYNRRNVFGAAVAYAPVLPSALRDPTLQYALCGGRRLLREMVPDILTSPGPITLVLEPLPGSNVGDLQTRFPVSCADPAGGQAR